jgi:hypothetical protein
VAHEEYEYEDDEYEDYEDDDYEPDRKPQMSFEPRLVRLEPRYSKRHFATKHIKSEPESHAAAAGSGTASNEEYILVTLDNLETSGKRLIGPYQCGVCFTKIKYYNDIRRHLRFECKVYCQKRFECQMCAKKYFRSSHLTRHMQAAHKMQTI